MIFPNKKCELYFINIKDTINTKYKIKKKR
jgi:hypothetical protein